MKTLLTTLTIVIITIFQASSQSDIYIARNVKRAFTVGTRSFNGEPGKNYWQNSSNYTIKVNIDLENHLLRGSETIKYFNNSPDTLKTIAIRLYQNIYKKGAARDFEIKDPDALSDGVNISKIKINENEIAADSKNVTVTGTVLTIKPVTQVAPQSVTNLEFEWSFPLQDKVQIRMGGYDSTSYLIGYWYPQISVYDDIDGWDTYSYTGLQEFYNDFNNYEVEITVPENFCAWGTGILQNPNEVLNDQYLERYMLAQKSDSVIRIITSSDLIDGNVFKNNPANTWKFKADNVTDYAFAFSDHYLWDGTSLEVDHETGRRVFIDAAYKKESEDFYEVARIARETIEHLSFKMPAVPFPFPCLTVFNGSGGMEFPMMVNDGSTPTIERTVGLTSHEISHQYFPFYMGTNEEKYAFMDEGWAVFLPLELQQKYIKNSFPRLREIKNYENQAGTETEMPLMVPSELLNWKSYRTSAYARSSVAYRFLHDLLGDSLFLSALQEFIHTWNGKHPIPYDFFFTFNRAAGKDLSWFWKPWFFESGYPDLELKKAVVDGNLLKIEVYKAGNIPTTVVIKILYEDGTENEIHKSVEVWENTDTLKINFEISKPVKQVILGSEEIPDSNRENNMIVIH